MTDSLEISDNARRAFSDELIEWFENSELADDDTTARVVELVERVCEEAGANPDVQTAVAVAYLHRAPEIATGPDGEPIEDFDDIPDLYNRALVKALRGHASKAAFDQHCSEDEERLPAAVVHMAKRWADGNPSKRWARDFVEYYCYGPMGRFQTAQVDRAVQTVEREVLE